MKNRTNNDQEIQISSFIKEPASLKLLILAGTNIKVSQLNTLSRCSGLIKLDLSGNMLSEMSLKMNLFPQLKVLYLHDNQLSHIDIKKTTLEYISLFNNLFKQNSYRKQLIEQNPHLKGIDFNVITQKQIYGNVRSVKDLPVYSEIKWPIVQISSALQHEEDYLNLLKAEIFVINNVYKRTTNIQCIQRIFKGVAQNYNYSQTDLLAIDIEDLGKPSVRKAAKKWIQYTKLRKKLRAILCKKGKQYLIMNQMQLKKKDRGSGVNEVMDAFLPMVRLKMRARAILERNTRAFKRFIPAKRMLENQFFGFTPERDYTTQPVKLCFRYSQQQLLSKVCLFAKKLFFQEKDYDICDDFNTLFKESGRSFTIIKKNDYLSNQNAWLLNTIHQTTGYILREEGIDRKHLLYFRSGHKKIPVKSITKYKLNTNQREKLQRTDRKLDYREQKYDKLLEFQVKSYKILSTILKIIRFVNAGNSSSIISNETAYFQTEVITEDPQQKEKPRIRIHLGLQFFVRRVNAANIIQRFFRKKISQRREKISIIKEIKQQRAEKLLQKWLNRIIFDHRMISCKVSSYQKSIWRQNEIYLHLDIYMNMPQPTNFLRFQNQLSSKDQFYKVIHKDTQVQIVQFSNRKWLKVIYPNYQKAFKASEIFRKFTYKYYYNGFSIRLFTHEEIKNHGLLKEYESKVQKLFKIQMHVAENNQKPTGAKQLWIQNPQPFFVWSQIQPIEALKNFTELNRKNINTNIFIYNKHQRPLKVSCQFFWVNPDSIYPNRKAVISLKSSQRLQQSPLPLPVRLGKNNHIFNEPAELSLLQASYRKGKKYHVEKSFQKQSHRNRKNSLGGSRNSSLNKSHRTRIVSDHKFDLLSETLNIRRK